MTKRDAFDRLVEIRKYDYDWSQSGAMKISENAIIEAHSLIELKDIDPISIIPLNNGNIKLVYYNTQGINECFYLGEDGLIKITKEKSNN